MMYKVKSNLKKDGTLYVKGDEVDLDKNDALQLLSDNVVVAIDKEIEENDKESIQPPVNKVSRKDDETTGETKVEQGKIEKPQPGDEVKNNEPEKTIYQVLKGLEYPKGKVHKVGDVIELTGEQVGKFSEGLIEEVEEDENL